MWNKAGFPVSDDCNGIMEMKQYSHFSRWTNLPREKSSIYRAISLRLWHKATRHPKPRWKQTLHHLTVAILVNIFWVFRFVYSIFFFFFLNLKLFLLFVIWNCSQHLLKKFKLLFAFWLALESFIFFWYESNWLPQSQQSKTQYLKSWVLSFSGKRFAYTYLLQG